MTIVLIYLANLDSKITELVGMNDISINNFFELNGIGTVRFDSSEDITNAKFDLFLHYNGKITGNLEFDNPNDSLFGYLRKMEEFNLEGEIASSNKKIVAERCVLTSLTDSSSQPKSRFKTHNVLISAESIKRKPTGDFLIEFGLLNVYETFRVIVETKVGTIYLSHYQGIEEFNQLMLLYHIPLITSVAKLQIKADGSKTLEEILDNITTVIEDFLKITSLSQSVWHEWVFISVIERVGNSDQDSLVFQRFRRPKSKVPVLRQLTNDSYSSEFIKSAWIGYSRELDEKYGTFALEWYIESNLVDTIEFKVLNASTCLEMLMDKFTSQQRSEYIMDEETFDQFRNKLQRQAKKILKVLEKGESTRDSIYKNLGGINRRSYVNKARDLLDYWGVSYDDTELGFEEIVKVRDDVTHRGKYYSKESDFEYENIFKAYKSLALILPRIFLAMLKYDGQYYESITDRWIPFNDVCRKR